MKHVLLSLCFEILPILKKACIIILNCDFANHTLKKIRRLPIQNKELFTKFRRIYHL